MKPPRFPDEFWWKLMERGMAPASLEHGEDDGEESLFANRLGLTPEAVEEPADHQPLHFALPDKPLVLCVPDGYEPNYAYPLVIWLHAAGSNEQELARLMPLLSTRNYFGLSFRAPIAAAELMPGGFRWPEDQADLLPFESELHETVCELRKQCHIHSERIYLAGFAEGATTALHLLLRRPEWFAGAVSLGGRFPTACRPLLSRYRDLHGKRVLIGTGHRDRRVSIVDLVQTGRLLHTAGLDICTRVFDAAHEVTDEMLAEVNRWLMEGLHATRVA